MDKSTSKAVAAGDAGLAAATMMNANGPGSALFVINLCASMAPIANIGKSLPGLESYRLYQVARREDGRTRHRLRLGFFSNEADAEAVLNRIRSSYPTAFTACLCDEDRKFVRGYVTEPSARATSAPKTAVVVANTPGAVAVPVALSTTSNKSARALSPERSAVTTETQKPFVATQTPSIPATATVELKSPSATATTTQLPKPVATPSSSPAPAPRARTPTVQPPSHRAVAPPIQSATVASAAASTPKPRASAPAKPAAAKGIIEAPSRLLASIELSLETEPAPAPQAESTATPSTEPFRLSRGVDIPATSLTLEATAPPAVPTPIVTATPAAPAQSVNDTSKMKMAQAAANKEAALRSAQSAVAQLPDLDSTQTIRALTSDELQDESQEKWFSIQLAVSDQPVNLDAMPRLDIFEAYRLYSVASAGSGKITHSLRIGFFREEVSARAVCGYLKTFFPAPDVVRISIAEHARFKDPPVVKTASRTEAKVLDLSHARDRAKTIPTVTMAVETPRFDSGATGGFRAATGTHKALATGSHKALATGSHRALTATGSHRTLNATGSHKALTKTTPVASKTATSDKHKALRAKKTLAQQLIDEAREVDLSESGIRKLPKNSSLLSKMFGKRK